MQARHGGRARVQGTRDSCDTERMANKDTRAAWSTLSREATDVNLNVHSESGVCLVGTRNLRIPRHRPNSAQRSPALVFLQFGTQNAELLRGGARGPGLATLANPRRPECNSRSAPWLSKNPLNGLRRCGRSVTQGQPIGFPRAHSTACVAAARARAHCARPWASVHLPVDARVDLLGGAQVVNLQDVLGRDVLMIRPAGAQDDAVLCHVELDPILNRAGHVDVD